MTKMNEYTKAKIIRQKRNYLLNKTDKYMISDYPLTKEQKAKVIEYRQMLRDLPKQNGFPNIEIPKLEF